MSVINKMLRDLDQRQGSPSAQTAPGAQAAPSVLGQGTRVIPDGNARAGGRAGPSARLGVWLGLSALVAAAGAGAWLWTQASRAPSGADRASAALASAPRPASAAPAPLAVAALVPAASASAPANDTAPAPLAAPASVAAAASVPVPQPAQAPSATPVNSGRTPVLASTAANTATPTAMALRMEQSLSARRALDAVLAAPSAPAPTPASTLATAPVVSATPERAKLRSMAAAPAVATSPGSEAAKAVQRQQQAEGDVMAQAQSLWNAGSHDAAMDLVQQSIAVAERNAKGGANAGGNPVLLPLVREMARMQLAEARFGAVWEMLTRLEPLLGNQSDLWAIRANAAQRLGRHQDSVHAYLVALQSRPDEQRWLLGAAVSLAALGQTSSAAEMADKARALGPVGKDILAYLRQAGVPIRD